jgi:hypothetical protein
MITTRQSGARQRNASLTEIRGRQPSNVAWLARRARPGSVVLLGGSGLIDFRLRVAQSHLRSDLLPSFWSSAGIIVSPTILLTVPIDARLDPEMVPSHNAIHECAIADFDDPARYPNIAVVQFADRGDAIVAYARRLESQRSAIDLVQMLVPWLSFVWGAGTTGNPLQQNIGVPSAGMVETAFGIAGIELTPGVSSAASCPEAIWQSALWWHDFYRQTADAMPAGTHSTAAAAAPAGGIVPTGAYMVRQPAAAVVESTAERGPAARTTARGRRPKK